MSEMEKHHEELTKDLKHQSKVELEGSQFKDEMFIKLLKKRKKNSERYQNLKTGHLILKRTRMMNMKLVKRVKRQKMIAEWNNSKSFLMKTDKTEKPNKGIIMMMENLSASSSTIGIVQ